MLAHQGHTIICTIHQPAASHFQLFDQVYILAKGHCVYQGASKQLVPFMSSVGLHCPKHYNPADYGKYNASLFLRYTAVCVQPVLVLCPSFITEKAGVNHKVLNEICYFHKQ